MLPGGQSTLGCGPHSCGSHAVGHAMRVHAHCPFRQVQVLHPSSASRVSPSSHISGGQARSVHAHSPFEHTHVLHPSSASRVSPSAHISGGQARSVHAHCPSKQVQVLHPSSAGLLSPSIQTASTTQPSAVHAHITSGSDVIPSQSWSHCGRFEISSPVHVHAHRQVS